MKEIEARVLQAFETECFDKALGVGMDLRVVLDAVWKGAVGNKCCLAEKYKHSSTVRRRPVKAVSCVQGRRIVLGPNERSIV